MTVRPKHSSPKVEETNRKKDDHLTNQLHVWICFRDSYFTLFVVKVYSFGMFHAIINVSSVLVSD